MIDAQAVLAHLQALGNSSTHAQFADGVVINEWLDRELRQTALLSHTDATGNRWLTLHGESDQAVVLGSYRTVHPGDDPLGSHLGIVVGMEVIKAITRRDQRKPPCTLKLVIWAEARVADVNPAAHAGTVLMEQHAAAYLELHVEAETRPDLATGSLYVAIAVPENGLPGFNPRLMTLCDEAIRELTGTSTTLVSEAGQAVEIAREGVPSAVMCLVVPAGTAQTPQARHLHLQEAAEAFGRWTESTMHLLAGETIDLWALEHRAPHS